MVLVSAQLHAIRPLALILLLALLLIGRTVLAFVAALAAFVADEIALVFLSATAVAAVASTVSSGAIVSMATAAAATSSAGLVRRVSALLRLGCSPSTRRLRTVARGASRLHRVCDRATVVAVRV